MNFYVVLLFSASVYIPGIIGLIRLPKLETRYYPFLYFIWIGCINEFIGFLLIMNRQSNYISSNVYVLLASLFICWFFEKNGLFGKLNTLYHTILAIYIIAWLTEVLILKHITEITTFFRILFSFCTTLLSITMINNILISDTRRLVKNPMFLICTAFAFYFTYRVLVEAFWIYGLESSQSFLLLIWNISVFVNLFTNLIYAVALLWIPRKKPSILPY